ncbi:von Willebrand factor-like [Lampetra fluviatilis]
MPAKCDLRCDLKSGMEYQKCSSLCQRTCRDLGSPPAPCPSTCVEGCTCTEGTYLDSMRGGCVEASECSCYVDDAHLTPGESFRKGSSLCVCQNGLINCTEVSDPDCPSGEFLVSCSGEFQGLTEGSACEPSCGSPHIDRGRCPLPCSPGCVCPPG